MTQTRSSWSARTVAELCKLVTSGGTPSRSNPDFYSQGTIPWVKTGDLHDGYVIEYDEYVTESAIQNSSAKVLPEGTVLMAMYGATVGMLGMLAEPAACNQAACAMVANPDLCDPRWLFYALRNDRSRIVSRANGAAQQNLSGTTIKRLAFLTPDLAQQSAIADVLGALDDKIAINSRIADSAHALAKAEYASLMNSTGDTTTLGELLTLEYGKPLPATSRVPGPVDVFGSGGIVGSHNEAFAAGPGVVVGRKGTAGAVHWAARHFYPIDTTFYVVPKNAQVNSLIFCYFLLGSLGLREQNSDSAVPGLNRNGAHAMEVRLPDAELIRRFTLAAMPLTDLAAQAERESVSLAAIRDALLPQLMSGKLRVRDAEKVLEGVL
ncbi:restriction endonuclease subunit S [Cryobacterium sp. TMT4-10]|uniref:restriction endonuclease subunit S n=1 Tax=Cryobacterium sp. TMT4-10 TaxID=1259256 RepID=UPI00106D39ED|nr:restriction endonuclease subunit S [Cryobacterium sp. TMT4-10]TFD20919.1 hypothetical protein E3T42_01095 [Cryobacterium sp. TMT4-10]